MNEQAVIQQSVRLTSGHVRTRPDAGWVDHRQLPKGPGGRALCRQCSQEVPKGRRSFCSDGCVHEWKIRTNTAYVRRQVFKRDHGVCAACGLDTERASRIYGAAKEAEFRMRHGHGQRDWTWWDARELKVTTWLPEVWGIRKPYQSWWEANHKVAIAEGGGLCGLDGYETLCQACHRHHTADLRKRLAAQRKSR